MLGRHLACVVATMPGNGPVSPPAMERYVPLGDDLQQLTDRLREALPRLHDHALRQDLNQLLGMLERDVAPIMECWEEVRRWRKAQRQRLIADRLAATPEERHRRDALVEAQLRTCLPASGASQLIGFYWPFKGEYDPRPLMRALHGQGRRLALPVIAEQARPLVFREWWPGKRMVPGVWNIPVPAEGETVLPDTLVAPLVGFDGLGYRLGYGGGYYDRTLAAMADRPLTIGVGFDLSRLETIYPQPHDIPMHLIVTEDGVSSLPDKSPAAAHAQAAGERGNQ
jgi:5-formyltetrahydrofolate cyclo-ligase